MYQAVGVPREGARVNEYEWLSFKWLKWKPVEVSGFAEVSFDLARL